MQLFDWPGIVCTVGALDLEYSSGLCSRSARLSRTSATGFSGSSRRVLVQESNSVTGQSLFVLVVI